MRVGLKLNKMPLLHLLKSTLYSSYFNNTLKINGAQFNLMPEKSMGGVGSLIYFTNMNDLNSYITKKKLHSII